MRDITAVLGIYMDCPRQLERTKAFVEDLNQRFPDVPMSLSCVGSPKEYQDELKRLYGEEIITGTTERVSFSETWNSATTGVKTSKFVLLHNDMYLDDEFFDQLECYYLKDSKKFYVYTTVEPLNNMGFVRPGKIVAKFGDDFDNFEKEKFLKFAKTYKETHHFEGRGYGFYLAGFIESFRDVGGFDFIDFSPIFCEDDDLLIRIRKKGYLLCTAPAAVLYHFGSKTTREMGAKGMSASEIEQNRKFARKWGFEARYLWRTGYEFYDTPTETGTEKIGFQIGEGFNVPLMELLNVEPLVDKINIMPTPEFTKYLQDYKIENKAGTLEDCDIVITQVGPTDFNLFANLMGELRFKYKHLEEGKTLQAGSYVVEIKKLHKDLNRLDSRNYLSLQKV